MVKTRLNAAWRKLLSLAKEKFGLSNRGVVWLLIIAGVALLDVVLACALWAGY